MNVKRLMIVLASALLGFSGWAQTEDVAILAPEITPGMSTYLGVHVTPIQPETASQLDIDPDLGVVASLVEKGSPAEEAGVQQFDILLQLDDQLLIGTRQIGVLVRSKKPGDSIVLTYLRKGERNTLEVVLAERERGERSRFSKPVGAFFGRNFSMSAPDPKPNISIGLEGRIIDVEDLHERIIGIQENLEAARDHPQFKQMPPIDIHRGASIMQWRDDASKIDIEMNNGERRMKIFDQEGNEIFSGPVNSDEDLNKVPEKYRANIRAIEKIGSSNGNDA